MASAVVDRCPVCHGSQLVLFLERDGVPVFQNVLYKYRSEALEVDRGRLRMQACADCDFVFNAAFDPSKAQYDRRYDNNQTCSHEFSTYLEGHIARIAAQARPDATIVEVGCGNGWFLERLVSAMPQSRGVGFDPAYRGAAASNDGRIRYFSRFFEATDFGIQADVVVCRHVIEHVANPVELLVAVRGALEQSRRPLVFFETPCVEWILRGLVIWDFFYEHCSYFNPESLKMAFGQAGFSVERIEHVFGGQYLWLEANVGKAAFVTQAGSVGKEAAAFGREEPQLRATWMARLQELGRSGKVAVWGAGAKGVTFLNVIDSQAELIDCVVDISPDKQGRFVGGTGHPVVSVGELARRGVTSALLMNPNYRNENLRLLAAAAQSSVLLVG